MDRIHIASYLLLAASSAVLGQTLSTPPKFSCRVQPPKGYKLFLIDASNMTRSADSPLQYKNDDKLFIEVENINPFVTHYTIKIKRSAVAESALTSFLPIIGGVASQLMDKPTSKANPAGAPTMDALQQALSEIVINPNVEGPPEKCSALRSALDSKTTDLKELDARINNTLKAIGSNYALTDRFSAQP